MGNVAARIFFCFVPAALYGVAFGMATHSMFVAVIVFLGMFGFGMQVTDSGNGGRE
jgi:hypothetical protein